MVDLEEEYYVWHCGHKIKTRFKIKGTVNCPTCWFEELSEKAEEEKARRRDEIAQLVDKWEEDHRS